MAPSSKIETFIDGFLMNTLANCKKKRDKQRAQQAQYDDIAFSKKEQFLGLEIAC